jgi:hypothetical protein
MKRYEPTTALVVDRPVQQPIGQPGHHRDVGQLDRAVECDDRAPASAVVVDRTRLILRRQRPIGRSRRRREPKPAATDVRGGGGDDGGRRLQSIFAAERRVGSYDSFRSSFVLFGCLWTDELAGRLPDKPDSVSARHSSSPSAEQRARPAPPGDRAPSFVDLHRGW